MKAQRSAIAQITWINYNNFGTFLQAYSLQQVLKRIGFISYIIDDKRFIKTNPSKLFLARLFHSLKNKPSYIFDQYKIDSLYKAFRNNFLNIDNSWKTLEDLSSKYSEFICGSDQIWSPILRDHNDGFYFASFAPENAKKIAYAPSLGSKTYSKDYETLVKPWLKGFQFLSAREKRGAEILEEISGCHVQTVLDPTLLLSHNDWVRFEKGNPRNPLSPDSHYLLAYMLSFNCVYLKRIKEIAEEKNLKLVFINNLDGLSEYADKCVNCGPLEFLSLIVNSTFFITDSFHGTIFALQFHKHFLTLKRFKENSAISQNSRIENLFHIIKMKDNFLDDSNFDKLPNLPDWDYIDKCLSEERKKSIQYLQEAFR